MAKRPDGYLTPQKRPKVFLAGLNYYDETPLIVERDRPLHAIYYGGTGSGKTAMLAFAIEQAVHAGEHVIVIDLKGMDCILYAAMCAAAERCGIDPPKYLTNRHRASTYLVPVLQAEWWKHTFSSEEKAGALMTALGLADVQSHDWWSDAAEALYSFVTDEVDPDEIDTFVKFYDVLERRKRDLPKELRNATVHAAILARRLERIAMFNPDGNAPPEAIEHAIDLQDLVRSGKQTLVFASLNSLRTQKTSSTIARFLGRALLLAADALEENQRGRSLIAVDEAQNCLGPGFTDVCLTLSRSAGVSFHAGFQDISVLRHRGIDYAALFDENAHLQFMFAAQSPDAIRRQVVLSGERLEFNYSKTFTYPGFFGHRSWSETFSGHITNRFSINDILEVSADPQRFIFRCTKDSTLCQLRGLPVMAKVIWHISKEEFQRRSAMSWPEPCNRTVMCGASKLHSLPDATDANIPIPSTGIPPTTDKPIVLRPPRR
ncbi:MAG: type IV secretion system DNA-binding domain-containing protein [Pirellulaceae bacterium]